MFERKNISDEKLSIISNNDRNIKVIYIVDAMNNNECEQYQEYLMKIQKIQGYCLFLSVIDNNYYLSKLTTIFYQQNIDGIWKGHVLTEGYLNEYNISKSGSLLFKNDLMLHILLKKRKDLKIKKEEEVKQREIISKTKAENEIKKLLAEKDKMIKEQSAKEAHEFKKAKQVQAFQDAYESGIVDSNEPIRDEYGTRWIKCELCGRFAPESEFRIYGGIGKVNLGKCNKCI